MNDLILYLDSKDALSAGFESSVDYAYCLLVRMPASSTNVFSLMNGTENSIDSIVFKLLQDKEMVSLILTDVLYYRFLMSIASVFAIHSQPSVMDLLIRSAAQVFDSMPRKEVTSLLEAPDFNSVERILDSIRGAAMALDEVLSIQLITRIREIQVRMYSGVSGDILNSFVRDSSSVIPFSLLTRKNEITRFVMDNRSIVTCNPNSYIFTQLKGVEVKGGELNLFKSINEFCVAICTVFSALLVDGKDDEELKDTYKIIWNFIIKTKSSCFLPYQAYDKARMLLL